MSTWDKLVRVAFTPIFLIFFFVNVANARFISSPDDFSLKEVTKEGKEIEARKWIENIIDTRSKLIISFTNKIREDNIPVQIRVVKKVKKKEKEIPLSNFSAISLEGKFNRNNPSGSFIPPSTELKMSDFEEDSIIIVSIFNPQESGEPPSDTTYTFRVKKLGFSPRFIAYPFFLEYNTDGKKLIVSSQFSFLAGVKCRTRFWENMSLAINLVPSDEHFLEFKEVGIGLSVYKVLQFGYATKKKCLFFAIVSKDTIDFLIGIFKQRE
jgi:hypothetical protein